MVDFALATLATLFRAIVVSQRKLVRTALVVVGFVDHVRTFHRLRKSLNCNSRASLDSVKGGRTTGNALWYRVGPVAQMDRAADF